MATIDYQCDTCKREITLVENPRGLTTFSRCIITSGCSGKLYKSKRISSGSRESVPSPVLDLQDKTFRRVFEKYNQDISSKKWLITHSLFTHPLTIVYINDNGVERKLDDDQYEVNFLSVTTLEIIFNSEYTGRVHMLSRFSEAPLVETNPSSISSIAISERGTLTFAVPKFITKFQQPPSPGTVLPYNTFTGNGITIDVILERANREPVSCTERLVPYSFNSIWRGLKEILVKKRRNYYIFSKRIEDFTVFQDQELTLDKIEDGTILRIVGINYGEGGMNQIRSKGLLGLLSRSGTSGFSRVLDAYLDYGEENSGEFPALVFLNGEFTLPESQIQSTYPNIERVI